MQWKEHYVYTHISTSSNDLLFMHEEWFIRGFFVSIQQLVRTATELDQASGGRWSTVYPQVM